MKRPLAAFGLCFFIVAFVACQLPRWLLVPLALVFLAGFLTALLLLARRTRISGQRIGVLACFPIFMAAAGLALWYNLGYTEVFVRPVADLAGEERAVVARVEDVEPGYGDDTVHARLAVLEMESGEPVPAFRVVVRGIPDVEIGQIVRMDLQFYAFSGPSVASNSWADGCYIGARAKSAPKVKGESLTFLCRIRILRNNAADNIDDQLPQRLASVAAAMAVGDRRFLSDGTVQNYRMAGLSHLLVVSGLHMSILSGITYLILQRLIRNRYAVSIASISVVVLFMLLTGMTASVVRSGVACMLVYLAGMTAHKADIFTSMALAAVLLGLQNPYSVVDVGLLLSFAATLGAVCGRSGFPKRGGSKTGRASCVPAGRFARLRRFRWLLHSLPCRCSFGQGWVRPCLPFP